MNTRRRLLVEMQAACSRLWDTASRGDAHRFEDDDVYRHAIAFLWLRLGEPASRLMAQRLIDVSQVPQWAWLVATRNSLAHGADSEIDYPSLWESLPTVAVSTERDVARLLAS
ncbi:MAG: hypothetical protein QG597_1242 [Actinomycetota bacterium]|nr:hypothetical protein [Actinomycetota bacterium]